MISERPFFSSVEIRVSDILTPSIPLEDEIYEVSDEEEFGNKTRLPEASPCMFEAPEHKTQEEHDSYCRKGNDSTSNTISTQTAVTVAAEEGHGNF